jgi:hypothetical protein
LIETAGFAKARIVYDGGEPQAQAAALALGNRLSWRMAVEIIDLGPGVDPSDVDDQTKQELMRNE